MKNRPTVLVQLGHFRPGYRANGPNRSVVRAAEALKDRFEFRVISLAAPGEAVGTWHCFDGLDRIALAPGRPFASGLRSVLRETPHDLLICNGLFNRTLTLPTLLIRRTGQLKSPLLLAPRGEFSPGALGLKSLRKRAYIRLLENTGLLDGVSLQATDDVEAARIAAHLPASPVLIGPNVRQLEPLPPHRPRAAGEPLRIIFLSRIDRMKNLDWALDLLATSQQPVRFDIFGPVTDPAYWAECQSRIASLPAHVRVAIGGEVDPAAVAPLLAGYDLFLLPTRGENFGHAIADALLAGTSALIADTTPWRGLEAKRAGADLPLGDPSAWLNFIELLAEEQPNDILLRRAAARRFAEDRLGGDGDRDRLAACLEQAVSQR